MITCQKLILSLEYSIMNLNVLCTELQYVRKSLNSSSEPLNIPLMSSKNLNQILGHFLCWYMLLFYIICKGICIKGSYSCTHGCSIDLQKMFSIKGEIIISYENYENYIKNMIEKLLGIFADGKNWRGRWRTSLTIEDLP